MKARIWFRLACIAVLLASALLLAGCNPFGGGATPTPTRVIVPFVPPTPTATPTPAPTATPAPVPTPTPATKLTVAQVTQLVFLQVRTCADQLASEGSKVDLVIIPVYSAVERQWAIDVITKDVAIDFGKYRVSDATGEVTSSDIIAAQILQPGVTCAEPAARLTKGPVPPRITITATGAAAAVPTPTPVPVIGSVIGSDEEARLGVWLAAYNCYGVYPELASFTAYPYTAGTWVVEGKTTDTHYGLWQVDGSTGKITPLDLAAAQAADKCNLAAPVSIPPAVTGGQAEVRVWITLYDCYDPKPKRTSFKVYADNPQRWLVEGRADETVGGITQTFFYGLWTVEASKGDIAPWDGVARLMANSACYHKL